jgi:hypothetical protein
MRLLDNPKAQRRHDRARLKAKRRFHFGFDHAAPGLEKRWASLIDTPRPCSCPMCGNPRTYFGTPSIQELRDNQPALRSDPWRDYLDGL